MTDEPRCVETELLFEHVLEVLPAQEAARIEAHLAGCAACRRELAMLAPIADSFAAPPAAGARPPSSLWSRLAERVGVEAQEVPPSPAWWSEPEWKQVAPGIACKLLATDASRRRVSMLVRLDPGAGYPPHRHADLEELHLLHGELWIDDRKLRPGDYNRGDPGATDQRVYTDTGCTCVLITSTRDELI